MCQSIFWFNMSNQDTPAIKVSTPKVPNTGIDQIYGEPKITNIAREN